MSVPVVGAAGAAGVNPSQLFTQYTQQVLGAGGLDQTGASSAAMQAAGTRSADFASMIGGNLQQLENLDKTASTKAVQAATGDLTDIQDYVIAATQAQTATELTTTVRNKALDSFNEIMRMSL